MASTRQNVSDGGGKPLGWIEIDERGNKRVYSFTNGIVGYYYKDINRTITIGGKIVACCDCATALLFN